MRAERPRWRINLAYGLTDRLLIGLEYNPVVREIIPTLNYTLLKEHEIGESPLVSLGTSSDRIFSPEGTRSYFVTAAKAIHDSPFSPYVSINYSEWEKTLTFPFGVNVMVAPQWDFMVQNDGRNTHWLVNYKQDRWNASLMLIKGKSFGISTGVKF